MAEVIWTESALSDLIEQKTLEAFKSELQKGEFDVSWLARYLDTVLNSDDIVIYWN